MADRKKSGKPRASKGRDKSYRMKELPEASNRRQRQVSATDSTYAERGSDNEERRLQSFGSTKGGFHRDSDEEGSEEEPEASNIRPSRPKVHTDFSKTPTGSPTKTSTTPRTPRSRKESSRTPTSSRETGLPTKSHGKRPGRRSPRKTSGAGTELESSLDPTQRRFPTPSERTSAAATAGGGEDRRQRRNDPRQEARNPRQGGDNTQRADPTRMVIRPTSTTSSTRAVHQGWNAQQDSEGTTWCEDHCGPGYRKCNVM